MTQHTVAEEIKKLNITKKVVVDEFMQLFKSKHAQVPIKGKYIQQKHIVNKICLPMFLKDEEGGN